MEHTEINIYARLHVQLFLTWYTFFLTVNFAVMGWFTSALLTSQLKRSLPVIVVTAFFLMQNVLSWMAIHDFRKHFQGIHNRCRAILDLMYIQIPESTAKPQVAMPMLFYSRVIGLMYTTVSSFILFWIALMILAIYLVPL